MTRTPSPTCSRCRTRLTRDTWCQDQRFYCATCYPDHEYVFGHALSADVSEHSHAAGLTGN